MKISGFSYIRNGFTYGYPFLEAIQSILPICDEFVIAVGNSEDDTKKAIMDLKDPRIKVIDTIWDETLRENGKVFAQQANIALLQCKGDWLFHIQADELVHEANLQEIKNEIAKVNEDNNIEGLLFDFLNFFGSYSYLNDTRYQHKKEIRIIRNNIDIFSYKDSQGFRKYPSNQAYQDGHPGFKIKVKYIKVPIYHYSYVRTPKKMLEKSKYFESFWHSDDYLNENYKEKKEFNFYNIEKVKAFNGNHPALMKELVENGDYSFNPDLLSKKIRLKDKVGYWLDNVLGFRVGEFKNYIIVD